MVELTVFLLTQLSLPHSTIRDYIDFDDLADTITAYTDDYGLKILHVFVVICFNVRLQSEMIEWRRP